MTCAKKQVFCHIYTENGETFIGENWCRTPQLFCPREHGEGLEKCKTICNQDNHAEVDALLKAGDKAKNATAIVSGITWCCRDCQEKMVEAGIRYIGIRP